MAVLCWRAAERTRMLMAIPEQPHSAEPTASGSATHRIHPERHLVVLTYVGALKPSDIFLMQAKLRADPAFDPTFAVLFDGTRADLSTFDAAAVRRMAHNSPFAAGAPRAFMVSPGLHYGLVRIYQAFTDMAGRGEAVAIFEDLSAAMDWIFDRKRG